MADTLAKLRDSRPAKKRGSGSTLANIRDTVKPLTMSDFERQLRAKIAAGGETVYVPDYPRRQPLQGVLNMDPVEMATGMPLVSGDENYGGLTQTALGGAADYMTPAYLQPGYEGPQTGLGPVGDALAGLGSVFQGGSATGPMGAPSSMLSQVAGRLPAADRAFGTAGGVKVPGRGLGKGLTELIGEATAAERNALQQRLAAEAGQASPSLAERIKAGWGNHEAMRSWQGELNALSKDDVEALVRQLGMRPTSTKANNITAILGASSQAARDAETAAYIRAGEPPDKTAFIETLRAQQAGGAPSAATRDQAMANLTGAAQKKNEMTAPEGITAYHGSPQFADRKIKKVADIPLAISNPKQAERNAALWFGKSRVVDKEGYPLTVYHASPSTNIEAFSHKRLGANTDEFSSSDGARRTSQLGTWFNEKDVSHKLAYGDSAAVYPAHLRIENPYYITLNDLTSELDKSSAASFKRRLKNNGYDGIVVDDSEFGGWSYVVFDPRQIKSAIGNSGEYGRNDSRIVR